MATKRKGKMQDIETSIEKQDVPTETVKTEVAKETSFKKMKPIEKTQKQILPTEKSAFATKGYVKKAFGIITSPQSGGLSFVVSPCSMTGKPNHKIIDIFDKRWTSVKTEYKGWFSDRYNYKLGSVKQISVQSDAWVMLCLYKDDKDVFSQKALDECTKQLIKTALYEKASLHFDKSVLEETPEWKDKIQEIVNSGVIVYTYE